VCDHVVCEEETLFSLSEVRLGLIPACIGPFVLDKIGAGACRSLFLSGERFSAHKAKEIGLVQEVVKGEENLGAAQKLLQENFSSCGPLAVKTAKRFLREIKSLALPEANDLAAKTLADLRVGKEAQEGIRAFFEKRKPRW
jgi:methylglutaconyl-CoA hydratase